MKIKGYFVKSYHVYKSMFVSLFNIKTSVELSEFKKIHKNVKFKHEYIKDAVQYDKNDYWVASYKGDCEDFALMCYKKLREKGVNAFALKIVRCITETGNSHAVLIVNNKWVLDNRQKRVVSKETLPYTWKSWFSF